ncbi:MAG: ATP-binding cassette domain-containing protein [Candidatus Zixiibacteriota bacterium]
MKWPLVHIEHVVSRTDRGDDLFSDLNLTLEPGRSALIIGGAGSGKTRLAELLMGLRFPVSGKIDLFGESLRKRRYGTIRRIRRRIGGVGGPFALVNSLTVAENLTLPLVIAGEKQKVIKERLSNFLAEFGLMSNAGQYPSTLTRVENALVLLARASIAHQPLLLIDEPAAGLDPATSAKVYDYLIKASLSGRSMLILSSQLLPIDIPNCDKYAFHKGEVACFE